MSPVLFFFSLSLGLLTTHSPTNQARFKNAKSLRTCIASWQNTKKQTTKTQKNPVAFCAEMKGVLRLILILILLSSNLLN